jgi:putative acyl-CoA dehydrogenase
MDVLLREITAGGEDLGKKVRPLSGLLADGGRAEPQARRIVELIALALQASLMARHASQEAANAFRASRLEGDWGRALGTLSAAVPFLRIVERQGLAQ